MPKPRIYSPEDQTPFARRLQEWMWSQRPPMTNGQVAVRVGVSSQVVWDWLNRGSIPAPARLPAVEKLTGIPLFEWYKLAGYPVPDLPRYQPLPPPETPDEELERRIREVVWTVRQSMRAKGRTEHEIEAVVQGIPTYMRDERYGTDRVRFIEREFAHPSPEQVVDADIAERPTQTLQRIQPSGPEQQERRAPRKRTTAPARRSPSSLSPTRKGKQK